MPNRLRGASSPYLRQHADQPVDWYPWADEALREARDGDRPILLSIGYAACHWCHVMAHESFDDPEIAARMNAWFVNIKVDREARPDLDRTYQLAHQLLSGPPAALPEPTLAALPHRGRKLRATRRPAHRGLPTRFHQPRDLSISLRACFPCCSPS